MTAATAPQQTAAATAPATAMGDTTMYCTAMVATAAAGVLARGKRSKVTRKALHGIKFPYSLQKDTHAAGWSSMCFILCCLVLFLSELGADALSRTHCSG